MSHEQTTLNQYVRGHVDRQRIMLCNKDDSESDFTIDKNTFQFIMKRIGCNMDDFHVPELILMRGYMELTLKSNGEKFSLRTFSPQICCHYGVWM
jgi:hypothetical protein